VIGPARVGRERAAVAVEAVGHAERDGELHGRFLRRVTVPVPGFEATTADLRADGRAASLAGAAVRAKLWNGTRADKGGFIGEAFGWQPSAYQATFDALLLARASGIQFG
jgi:hypothetical protein